MEVPTLNRTIRIEPAVIHSMLCMLLFELRRDLRCALRTSRASRVQVIIKALSASDATDNKALRKF